MVDIKVFKRKRDLLRGEDIWEDITDNVDIDSLAIYQKKLRCFEIGKDKFSHERRIEAKIELIGKVLDHDDELMLVINGVEVLKGKPDRIFIKSERGEEIVCKAIIREGEIE